MTDTSPTTGTVTVENHFGGCPGCGKTDGYLNVGRKHWFVCDEHKTCWSPGENLFSSWHNESNADWSRNVAKLEAGYTIVEPLPCTENDIRSDPDPDIPTEPADVSLAMHPSTRRWSN